MEHDIGCKIKAARIEKKLTQEQVAELLGVSRQTISNWENEKSYPDIISVIKMSECYDVSLDYLLKGEQKMKSYYDYLEESTNVVKSNANRNKIITILSYLLIWAFAMIVFWFFTSGSDAMGYSLMFLWFILPISTFIVSIVIGKNNFWGKGKWAFTLFFGVMYMLAEYGTFKMANNIAFNKLNAPDLGMIVAGAIISAIGMLVGSLWNKKRHNQKNKKTMMVKFRFFKCNNLNLWRITIVDKAVIYIHGKGGNAEEAIHYKPLFSNCDVIGLDYTAQFPWEAKEEFPLLFNSIYRNYKTVEVIANSIGAYFAINALSNQQIEKAYFISPVVDMERLIADMMIWANVTEDELKEKKEIQTTFGETLSWDYLCYARENPIIWEIPTHILYGEKDNLTAYGTIFEFVQRTNSTLSIMKNGEHWFHTDEQMKFLDEWIIKSSK